MNFAKHVGRFATYAALAVNAVSACCCGGLPTSAVSADSYLQQVSPTVPANVAPAK